MTFASLQGMYASKPVASSITQAGQAVHNAASILVPQPVARTVALPGPARAQAWWNPYRSLKAPLAVQDVLTVTPYMRADTVNIGVLNRTQMRLSRVRCE